MNFELVRAGWPNTAAILMLAIMPIVALTGTNGQHPAAIQRTEAAAVCLALEECAVIAAVSSSDSLPE
jgi:hypothetical protein